MRKKKLRKKRVLALLLGIFAVSWAIHSTIQKASTETISFHMDPNYPNIEVSSLSAMGTHVEFPVFHIEKVDQAIQTYIKEYILDSDRKDENSESVVKYHIAHYSEQTVSILFHENQGEKVKTNTLTINLMDGTILSINDLVLEDKLDEFVNILSNATFSKWKNTNQPFWADREMFKDFILYNDSLLFYIKQEGQQDVPLAISKQLFSHVLKEQFQASEANQDLIKNREPREIITEQSKQGIEEFLNQKVIALTFDDGPKQGTTDKILDLLTKYNAHATFFVLGSMAEKNPDLLKRMSKEGQEIGNHTYNHKQMTKLTDEEIYTELKQTENLIQKITGKTSELMRPPYGSIDVRVRNVLNDDMEVMLWNIDTEDWKCRNTDEIVQEVMNNAADGKVILMHDIYQTSVEAVSIILEKLSSQGYKFVSASELLEIQKRRMMVNEGI